MFDLGIDERATSHKIDKIRNELETTHVVFLTHATFRHLGCLPIFWKLIQDKGIRIFATFPCIKFGSICLYEYLIDQSAIDRFDTFKISDVDSAFDLIYPMNFLQSRQIHLKDTGFFSVEALSAGFSIGGAAWKVSYQNNSFVFAFDVNDKNEKISMPVSYEKHFKDSYLITNGFFTHPLNKKINKMYPKDSEDQVHWLIEELIVQKIKAAVVAI